MRSGLMGVECMALINSLDNINEKYYEKGSDCDCWDGAGVSIWIPDTDEFKVDEKILL